MAFVNEKEKDRVVDYERNISMERANNPFGLIYKNPEADLLSTWNLCIDGYKVNFTMHQKIEPNPDKEGLCDLMCVVFQAVVPKELQHKKAEIKQYIEEAVWTYGYNYGKKNVADQYFSVDSKLKAFE